MSRTLHPVLARGHRAPRRAQRRGPRGVPRAASRRRPAPARPAAGSPAPTSRTASPPPTPPAKQALRGRTKPNLAIVSSLQRHALRAPALRDYPAVLKKAVIRAGGIAQFAGGVPAMCDGITQGRDGMQLSLYSRDVIAMSTAIALSHDMFDGALMLGVCDKIVPGPADRRAVVRPPADRLRARPGRWPPGCRTARRPGSASCTPRARSAARSCSRPRRRRTTRAGTCTFYGTANSNQLLMEVLGLHLPGLVVRQPRHPAARGADPRGRRPRDRADPPGRRAHADRRDRRREGDRQRLRRAARQRRLDQPHPAPGRDRPRRRHHADLGRPLRPVRGGAAADAGSTPTARRT